jgi:hypothetical protein
MNELLGGSFQYSTIVTAQHAIVIQSMRSRLNTMPFMQKRAEGFVILQLSDKTWRSLFLHDNLQAAI